MPIIVYRCPITQPVRRCGPEAAHTFKTAVLHNFPLHNPAKSCVIRLVIFYSSVSFSHRKVRKIETDSLTYTAVFHNFSLNIFAIVKKIAKLKPRK